MPSGKKRKRHKVATHKRKKRARANRHKRKSSLKLLFLFLKFIEIEKRHKDERQIDKRQNRLLSFNLLSKKLLLTGYNTC